MVQTHDASIHWPMFRPVIASNRLSICAFKVLRKSNALHKQNVYSRFWYLGWKILSTEMFIHDLWKICAVFVFFFRKKAGCFCFEIFWRWTIEFFCFVFIHVWCQWHEMKLLLPDCGWSQCPKIEMLFVARRLLCESYRQVEKHIFGATAMWSKPRRGNNTNRHSRHWKPTHVDFNVHGTVCRFHYALGLCKKRRMPPRRTNGCDGFPFIGNENRSREKINRSTSNWMVETLISTIKIA